MKQHTDKFCIGHSFIIVVLVPYFSVETKDSHSLFNFS